MTDEYISIRVTLPHTEFDRIKEVLKLEEESTYVAYPHLGHNGDNPHWHIFIPCTDKKGTDKFRARLKRSLGGGNKNYSVKFYENGILCGIQYGSREGSNPETQGLGSDLVSKAPKWEQREKSVVAGTKRKREQNEDHFKQITVRNIEKVTHRYWLDHQLSKTLDLSNVLALMCQDGWRLADNIMRQGLLSIYYDQFKHLINDESAYTEGFFRRIKVTPTFMQ